MNEIPTATTDSSDTADAAITEPEKAPELVLSTTATQQRDTFSSERL
jgi:hypothetical protein